MGSGTVLYSETLKQNPYYKTLRDCIASAILAEIPLLESPRAIRACEAHPYEYPCIASSQNPPVLNYLLGFGADLEYLSNGR